MADSGHVLNEYRELLKDVTHQAIGFVRRTLEQASRAFRTARFRVNCTVLRWRFELYLLSFAPSEADTAGYFDFAQLKIDVLAGAKGELSAAENKFNVRLWKEYAVLKWLFSQMSNNKSNKRQVDMKEPRKVLHTLLNSLQSLDKPSQCALCVDLARMELGLYYEPFDVRTSTLASQLADVSLSTIDTQINNGVGFFSFSGTTSSMLPTSSSSSSRGDKELLVLRSSLADLLIKHCLPGKQQQQHTATSTTNLKIEVTQATRILLGKREFQAEYARQLASVSADSSLGVQQVFLVFHKAYSLFLLCCNDLERLIELNDAAMCQHMTPLLHSQLVEFYLALLNHLFYATANTTTRLTKFMYKTKLFTIVRHALNAMGLVAASSSLLQLLRLTLLRFKVAHASTPFGSQLLESRDVDLMFDKVAAACARSQRRQPMQAAHAAAFMSAHIYAEVASKHVKSSASSVSFNRHQTRRLFQRAVQLCPQSLDTWLSYLQFEYDFVQAATNSGNVISKAQSDVMHNRLAFVYYQTLRNLAHCKLAYTSCVRSLPDKYIELMRIMADKEVRVYLPIHELNMLLEPIVPPGELEAATLTSNFTDEEVASDAAVEDESDSASEERENGEEDLEATDSDDSLLSRESAESFSLKKQSIKIFVYLYYSC